MDAADATTPEQPTRPLEPRSLNFDDVLPTDANLDSPFDDAALAEMAEGRLVHEGEGPALLTFDEFSRLTRENDHLDLSDAEIRGRFASLDPTGTGQVERRQWLQQALRDTLGRSISRILEIFFAWDVDGSGLIEPKEFRQAVRMLGFHAATNDEIDSVFAEFDVDADGSVTKVCAPPARAGPHAARQYSHISHAPRQARTRRPRPFFTLFGPAILYTMCTLRPRFSDCPLPHLPCVTSGCTFRCTRGVSLYLRWRSTVSCASTRG